jgi:geranylgeranyl reductase family protein
MHARVRGKKISCSFGFRFSYFVFRISYFVSSLPDSQGRTVELEGSAGELQKPLSSVPERTWDVLVVGAGPAGATAAFHLARAGHSVLLLDRKAFPRDKTCADGLIPDALGCLGRMGLLEEVRRRGHSCSALSIFSPSRIEVRIGGDFVGLRRRELDALVAGRAAEAGAAFAVGEAKAIRVDTSGDVLCAVSGAATALRARTAVLATGARADLAAALGMLEQARPSALAGRCYVRSPAPIDRLMVSCDRSIIPGYGWIFPMGGGLFNVGCGIFFRGRAEAKADLRAVFRTFTRRFPPARDLVSRGQVVGPFRGAMLRAGLRGARRLGAGRVLAAGETAGTTFPFTGEGIGKAMESGELAARVLSEALKAGDLDRLREYPARLEADLGPKYLGYRIAEDWLSLAWLSDLLHRRARGSRFLRKALEGIMTETADPREVFSVQGFLRSFSE